MAFDLPADYKQVPERIADLKEKHPDARLRPVNPDKPFDIVTVGDKTFIVYAAACYRDADDPLPAIGVAWEPFPGRTPYTRDSELMNAETSAWGRAIVAALRSESKAIASAEDVRNRQADQAGEVPPTNRRAGGTVRRSPNAHPAVDPETGEVAAPRASAEKPATLKQIGLIKALGRDHELSPDDLKIVIDGAVGRQTTGWSDLSAAEASRVIDQFKKADGEPAAAAKGEEPFQ